MMQSLRKVAAAVLLGGLIVAFALSIGARNFIGASSQPPLASVGSLEITAKEFQLNYRRAVQNLSAQTRRRITPQEASANGLPQGVLQTLIENAALDEDAKALGVGISTEGLKESIYHNEIFHDDSGKFNKDKYEQSLSEAGYTPTGFEADLKTDLVRRQIRGVFERGAIVPKALLDAYNRYLNEQRTLTYFTLPETAAGVIAPPANDVLVRFYEDHKLQFQAPEVRKVAVLPIIPAALTGKIAVADADLKAVYDAKAAAYAVPERRKLEVLPFQTQAAADAAAAKLSAGGGDFLDVAKDAGFKQPDLDAGLVSKADFKDKYAANDAMVTAAFALEKGKVSAPVQGPLSTVLIRSIDIIPGQDRTFEEVKEQIRSELVKVKVTEEIEKDVKIVEEARTAAIPLSEIANKTGVPLVEVSLTSKGSGPDGNPIDIAGMQPAVLAAAAFKSDIGVENEALRGPQGAGYSWFDVTEITKARQKTFDEVKAAAETAWRGEKVRQALAAKAKELTVRIDKGEPAAAVAQSLQLEIKTSSPLKRNGAEPGLPISSVAQAFALTEGGAGSATGGDGFSRVIYQVAKIAPPPPLPELDAENMTQKLAQLVARDDVEQYVAGVKARVGVTLDPKTLAEIAGSPGEADAGGPGPIDSEE